MHVLYLYLLSHAVKEGEGGEEFESQRGRPKLVVGSFWHTIALASAIHNL